MKTPNVGTSVLTGLDIVDVDRFERLLARRGERLLLRLFTESERRAARAESLAARFAAKEAVLKLLGTGLSAGMTWHDVEVETGPRGEPRVVLTGGAERRARELGLGPISVSLTHAGAVAAAAAAALREEA